MKRYLFVVNPISGGQDKTEVQEQIRSFCLDKGLDFEIWETKKSKSLDQLTQTVEAFTPDIVVACGGDGTVNLVGRVLMGKPIAMAIIPLGSANGMAAELDIPSEPDEALELLIRGRTKKLDVVGINGTYHSFHLSDMGFNATIVENFEKSNIRGQLAYLIFFVKSLFSDHTRTYEFSFPQGKKRLPAAMVVIANGRKYGFGAEVNPIGRPDDGIFEVCIFKKYPWYAFFGMFFRFITGRLRTARYYVVFNTTHLEVTVDRPVELQVDGESKEEITQLQAKILPEKLLTIVPQ